MEYILIQRPDFKEIFLTQIKKLEILPSEKLIELYNRQVEVGIVGVYRQAVYLAALRKQFIDRFNQSPIELKKDILLTLTNKIKVQNGILKYMNGEILKNVNNG